MDTAPFYLTFRLATCTTLILAVLGLPLAYWLAYGRARWRTPVEAVVSLPLVLPPSVLGFYLLVMFSPQRGLGAWLSQWLDLRLVFTFEGMVVASVIYSLPFMVNPLQAGFSALSPALREAAYTLGKDRLTTLWRVLLPNMKPALLTAGVLTFVHTVGEFGVVLMIGGSIPDETRAVSVAIYDEVQALRYDTAHAYAAVLLVFTFLVLWLVYGLRQRLGASSWF